jgi:hypothetical protein
MAWKKLTTFWVGFTLASQTLFRKRFLATASQKALALRAKHD